MATTVGNESNLNERLANLVRLDHDAIAAYESAIERLDDASSKEKLAELMADHQEHTGNLGAHLQAMGHEVPAAGSMKSMLTQGKVLIAGLMGDKTICRP
jgi:rubrerythrin